MSIKNLIVTLTTLLIFCIGIHCNNINLVTGSNKLKHLFISKDSTKYLNHYIHQHHKQLKEKEESPFASYNSILNLKQTTFRPNTKFDLKYEVFGWYPYWDKDYYKTINFSLISTIAYFSYELDPHTGDPETVHDWNTTGLIDSALAHNCNVLLTVTNFDTENNSKFLKNKDAVSKLIENLYNYIEKRGAQGVCIDFEGIKKDDKALFTEFLTKLKTKFSNKNYKIYVALPCVDAYKSFDFESLSLVVDQFVIMGYAYTYKKSEYAEPDSPINTTGDWPDINLNNTTDYYLKYLPDSQIILALPFYGTLWETETDQIGAKSKGFIGYRTYNYIQKNIPAGKKIEPYSKSTYSFYETTDSKKYRQCWYNSDSSLTYKIEFIKQKKLKGLGIWALGYDQGYNDLWKVIANELTDSSKVDTTHIKKSKLDNIENILEDVVNHETIFILILLFVTVFGGIGLVISMFEPNTRVYFFSNNAFRFYYIAITLLFFVALLRLTGKIDNTEVLFGLGFILGVGAFYIANKIIKRKTKNIP